MIIKSIKAFRRYVEKKLNLLQPVSQLKDNRKNPEIPMSIIFFLPFYSYIIGKNTFLSIDQFSREDYIKNFFDSNRDMVASDSTIIRNLDNNMDKNELEKINYNLANNSNINDKLVNPVLNKKCAILDETSFNKDLFEVCLIAGTVNFVLDYNKIEKRGKELVSADKMIDNIKDNFGRNYINLFLCDGLYYSKNIFKKTKDSIGANCFVKTSENLNVIDDVKELIENNSTKVESYEGYDSKHSIDYKIQAVRNIKAPTIEYDLQVAIITETDVKKNTTETFYVITNDLSLTLEQLRYCAHKRWVIENNCFKQMNHLFRTKRKISKKESCILNLLWIIIIAYNILMLFLDRNNYCECFIPIKKTVKNVMDLLKTSLIIEYNPNV